VLVTEDTEPRGVYVVGQKGKLEVDSRAFLRVMMAGGKL
jgi:hypothetical protein